MNGLARFTHELWCAGFVLVRSNHNINNFLVAMPAMIHLVMKFSMTLSRVFVCMLERLFHSVLLVHPFSLVYGAHTMFSL